MRLPKGRTDKRTHLVNVTSQYRARQDAQQARFEIDAQTRLINEYSIERVLEVKIPKMKIPQSVLESGATKSGLQFIKAPAIGAQLGQTINFIIAGDVEVSGTDNPLYSVPVKSDFKGGLRGQYSLNKTALKILARQLGDETTNWVGARYTSFVGPTRNPRTNEQ